MKLEAVVRDEQSFLYMERYVDQGAKSYSPIAGKTEVPACYRPESDERFFDLLTVKAPINPVAIFEGNASPALFRRYVRSDGVLFPLHPATWGMAGDERLEEVQTLSREAPIRVAPTASTRTVLTLQYPGDTPPHFIKLHLPRRISRFNRRLLRKEIHNAIVATMKLTRTASGIGSERRFAVYFPMLSVSFLAEPPVIFRESRRPAANTRSRICAKRLSGGRLPLRKAVHG